MMADKVPERIEWAVRQLGLAGGETVLEIGCGRGVAVSLVCPLLRDGSMTAIDRSATAIGAARKLNQQWIAAGKAAFHETAVETMDGRLGAFDIVFAVNVNVFWLKAGPAFDSVRRLLRSGGSLSLFYEPPSPEQGLKIRKELSARMTESGFAGDFHETAADRSVLLAVTATPKD